jgi:hypothetical protein
MIRHVVLFRFRPGVSADERAAFHRAASRLADLVPAIAACTAGPALQLQPGFDYVLQVDVADAAAFAAYKAHPAHVRLIEEHIRPCVEETVRAQIEL